MVEMSGEACRSHEIQIHGAGIPQETVEASREYAWSFVVCRNQGVLEVKMERKDTGEYALSSS